MYIYVDVPNYYASFLMYFTLHENIKIVKTNGDGKSSMLFQGIWVAIIAQSRGFSTTIRVEERKEGRNANLKALSDR